MTKMNTTQRLAETLANELPNALGEDDHTHQIGQLLNVSGNYGDCKLLGRDSDEESLILRDVFISDSCKWISVASDKNEPIASGDTVWIGFSDHDISNFTGKNGYVVSSDRTHDLSDAVVEAVLKHG